MAKRIKKNRARYSISPNVITGILIAVIIFLFFVFVLPWMYNTEPNTRSIIDQIRESITRNFDNSSILLAFVILMGFLLAYLYRK